MSTLSDLGEIGAGGFLIAPSEWESLPLVLSSWHDPLREGLPAKNVRRELPSICLFRSPLWPEASLQDWIHAVNALHTYPPLAGESLFARTEACIRYAALHPEVVRGLLALERLK